MSFLEEFWGSNILDRFAQEKEQCSHSLMNNVGNELAP